MRTGERPAARAAWPIRHRRAGRGYTYLALLFAVAAGGAALAALGTQWQQAAQREREAELLFRGQQLRQALQRFHDQTPEGQPMLPTTLDALLTDTRWPVPRHHLRQLYADPFTGQADWLLLRRPDGGIVGLRSQSTRPLLLQTPPPGVQPAPGRTAPWQARDWGFQIDVRRGNTPRPRP